MSKAETAEMTLDERAAGRTVTRRIALISGEAAERLDTEANARHGGNRAAAFTAMLAEATGRNAETLADGITVEPPKAGERRTTKSGIAIPITADISGEAFKAFHKMERAYNAERDETAERIVLGYRA